MAEPSHLGEQLRRYRVAAGMTQDELAERASISARAISDLERGVIQTPRKDTLHLLAEALALVAEDRAAFIGLRRLAGAGKAAAAPAASAPSTPAPASGPAPGGTILPVGMLTFLIADVRGYTAYTHLHGDEAGARLATRFAALSGEVVAGGGGQVVEVRGDEVLAVFTSARKALRAAVDLVDRCAAETTPELPLRAGVGLDVGEPVAVAGGYRGEVLNVAARLCAQAGPGEVLASDGVVHLARRVEGLGYQDRGELTLKGITRPVRAWLVRTGEIGPAPSGAAAGPAAVSDGPAVKVATLVASTPRHNLPAALSSFVGREQARDRVHALLEAHRLVTLVGAGGVGKTRLALSVGEGLLDAYPDGVWLVQLAPLADAGLVPGAVAQALGVQEEAGRPVLDTLSDQCGGKRLLLVLDNCEHLVAACAVLAGTLLRAAPGLRILATSREALGVGGERHYRVPSLSVPDPRHLPSPELAGSYEAVRLFVARAQERRDEFALSAGNARAVAEICARLDGVPLAIELAAARVGTMSVEAIAARLDDRLRLLTGGGRDVLPRQRTLRAALDWSYDLLSAPEKVLLDRLAVFAGGCTLAAAEAVCAGDSVEEWDVLDLLGSLVNKSLVHLDEAGEEGRYRLLETVRQYGLERLEASGGAGAIRDRHLGHFLALAEEAYPQLTVTEQGAQLTGVEQGVWLARLEIEHDNLRSALQWAGVSGAVEEGLRLAGAVWIFWHMRGHHSEGRDWLQGLLAGGGGSPAVRSPVLNGAGNLAYVQGDFARATALHQEALALRRELGDTGGIAASLSNLGLVAEGQGEYQRAVALYEEALGLDRVLGDTSGIATSLINLGNVAQMQGDLERAAALHEEALALCRALGDTSGIASSLINLGGLACAQGEYGQATALHEEALAMFRSLGNTSLIAASIDNLGVVAHMQGEYRRAAALHEEALSVRRALGERYGIAESLIGLGQVIARQGDHARGMALLREGLDAGHAIGAGRFEAVAIEALAQLLVAEGQANLGGRLAGAAEVLRERRGMALDAALRAGHKSLQARRAADAAFAAVWAEGRALELDAVLRLALGDMRRRQGAHSSAAPAPEGRSTPCVRPNSLPRAPTE